MKAMRQRNILKLFSAVLLGALLLSACQPATRNAQPPNEAPKVDATPTAAQNSAQPQQIWISPAVPAPLRDAYIEGWGGQASATEQASANLHLDVAKPAEGSARGSVWTYALVAPFPTLIDDVTTQEIISVWSGSAFGRFAGKPLLMDESTLETFTALWGVPAADAVQVVPAEQLLDSAWNQMPALALIPFEKIEPKWKVLTIDGQSPIQKKFDAAIYPLTAQYRLTCAAPCQPPSALNLSFDNYDPAKLTTVILTGVTALVRATAAKMDIKGITYPGEVIRDTLREADVAHINNEVPFYGGCPKPDPNQGKQIFCSASRYVELLTDVGTDVIELSGDHFADYGEDAMYQTLKIYEDNNLPYYGGGYNVEDGRKPLLFEVNGSKIMFIGCNYKTIYASATDTIPGAVPCDFPYMTEQIKQYRAQGYLPISTFQYHEFDTPEARPQQMIDFRRMADAGAVIVSGSQAHVPQAMEFRNGAFIHYGVGNLFFDQSTKNTKREFLDRHVFYDGRYLGVELLTTLLVDQARPRFMTAEERAKF
ncbi:MAG: CapA family protein, partial [Anaerolineales bacterium]|nr:CapA family protein [Anaerolineales bacterium]